VVLLSFLGAPADASVVAPADAAGGVGIRLLDVPAGTAADPRALLYIVDRLAPGAEITRRIELANTSAAAAHVGLYSAAASVQDGSFLGADAHTANELSTWTAVDPGVSEVAAGGRAIATVTVRVPSDASPGERYAVVWAETQATPTNGGVTQIGRVGIRLYISIGTGAAPAASFTIDSLTASRSNGLPTVTASVRNAGGRALDMSGTLELVAGPGGLNAGPFAATLGTTLGIGESEPITINLDERVPDGPWSAELTLHSGLLTESVRATITFPASGSAPAVSTAAPPPLKSLPIAAAYVMLLAGATIVLILRITNLGHRRPARAMSTAAAGVGRP
jgi:hypothetical protein